MMQVTDSLFLFCIVSLVTDGAHEHYISAKISLTVTDIIYIVVLLVLVLVVINDEINTCNVDLNVLL